MPAVRPHPTRFALAGVTPNPFGCDTRIRLDLPREAKVRVEVFEVTGRLVRVLADTNLPPGTHVIAWSGDGEGGQPLAPGVYTLRMEAGDFMQSRRVVILR